MIKFDYIELVHRYYDSGRVKLGGLDYMVEYLVEKGSSVLVVESPLYPKINSDISITLITPQEKKQLFKLHLRYTNELLVWLVGVITDFYAVFRYRAFHKIFLTSDPLTSFPAIVLKTLGLVSFHYYHCTDYSKIRFKRKWLNEIYHWLLKISINKADLVGSVSQRIYDQVLPYKYKKLIYIPNSPSFSKYEKYRCDISERDSTSIVLTCLGISHRYKVLETIQLFNKLYEHNNDLTLTIIGSFDVEKDYYDKVSKLLNSFPCHQNVKFTGYITREQNCALIGKSYIGLSFYDEIDSFSRYADSLKIREYAAMGIPCVSDLVTSTAEEMSKWGAGFAVSKVEDSYDKILLLLENSNVYSEVSNKALLWAAELDKDKMLDEIKKTYFDQTTNKPTKS